MVVISQLTNPINSIGAGIPKSQEEVPSSFESVVQQSHIWWDPGQQKLQKGVEKTSGIIRR